MPEVPGISDASRAGPPSASNVTRIAKQVTFQTSKPVDRQPVRDATASAATPDAAAAPRDAGAVARIAAARRPAARRTSSRVPAPSQVTGKAATRRAPKTAKQAGKASAVAAAKSTARQSTKLTKAATAGMTGTPRSVTRDRAATAAKKKERAQGTSRGAPVASKRTAVASKGTTATSKKTAAASKKTAVASKKTSGTSKGTAARTKGTAATKGTAGRTKKATGASRGNRAAAKGVAAAPAKGAATAASRTARAIQPARTVDKAKPVKVKPVSAARTDKPVKARKSNQARPSTAAPAAKATRPGKAPTPGGAKSGRSASRAGSGALRPATLKAAARKTSAARSGARTGRLRAATGAQLVDATRAVEALALAMEGRPTIIDPLPFLPPRPATPADAPSPTSPSATTIATVDVVTPAARARHRSPAPGRGPKGPRPADGRSARQASRDGALASRDPVLEARLARLPDEALVGLLRGVEKEGLRVDREGRLSQRPHPAELGSPLTHPLITTDFSESQLELVTGVHPSAGACLSELTDVHRFVVAHLGDEAMWAASMPGELPEEALIPIGRYGTANIARAKTVYRIGLSHRYGRRMQTISGLHYNFSLPDSFWPHLFEAEADSAEPQVLQSRLYFSLIRNFRRWSWLLLYLFGASPAVTRTFIADRPHRLDPLGHDSFYLPHATSLRMGRLGYQSQAQASIAVSFNDLSAYAGALRQALHQPWPDYEKIGLRDGDNYFQLSTNLLQIENEYYGTIRPKRRIRSGERALRALGERGVEYVEARCLDLDPFAPAGIAESTARFMDAFLLACLLCDSPLDDDESPRLASHNQHTVAERGREPGLTLAVEDGEVGLRAWGEAILSRMRPIAEALDRNEAREAERAHAADDSVPGRRHRRAPLAAAGTRRGRAHQAAIDAAAAALEDPDRTISALVLARMVTDFDGSHQGFAFDQSLRHRENLLAHPLGDERLAEYHLMADESDRRRQHMEAEPAEPFEAFRERYISQV